MSISINITVSCSDSISNDYNITALTIWNCFQWLFTLS